MPDQLSQAEGREATIFSDDGEIFFRFSWAVVQIAYAAPGAACLKTLPSSGYESAGVLAEVSVW